MRAPVVIDLETKKTFREVKDNKDLGVSMLGLYNYADQKQYSFEESELNKAFPLLEGASVVIGFNIISFDLPVLQAYYPGKVTNFKTFDILDYVKETIGKRLSLNDLVNATLGKKKSGHGLLAIEYFREGKIDQLRSYCMDDVMLTKELFDYGAEHNEIVYLNERGKVSIPTTDWKKYLIPGDDDHSHLTLPF